MPEESAAHGGELVANPGPGPGPGSTEDRIIRATLELVGSHGLSSVTMSAIASGAGISRQTLYNHYRNADHIVAAATQRHHLDAIAMLESSMSVVSTPQERLAQLVRHVVGVAAHAGASLDARDALAPALREGLAGHDDAIRGHIGRTIEDGVSAGSFREDLDPRVDGALVQGVLDGAAGLAGADPGRASEVADAAQRAVLAMLTR